ncbi:CopD family protein [Tateyamaria omphalii]|uniref:copper resistance D family protein n=1 Tax=Tateyamaria omphalii TaxID=299262 RepID=UPI001C99C85E|nr:CopD family protein [Tateyamaria omphalii]MBY5932095.1 CopD family protein [Tateyamaria omphalii]
MPDLFGLASIATKFALYLGVLASVGTGLAAVLFRLNRYRGFAVGFAVLGMAATLLGFLLAGAALTGDASGMTDPEMLGLLWSTPVGTAVALRITGLGLFVLGLFVGRIGLGLSLIGGLLALWSFVHIGHIHDRGSLQLNLVLLFHLTAASIWIGILHPLRALSLDTAKLPEASEVGHRFGRMAAVFVPLLVLAGGYMSYELVGSISALLSGGYGQTLLLKVLFVAGLLGIAAANKLRFVPQMAAGDQAAARHLAKSISFEWMVISVILFATAALTSVLTLPS